MVLLTIIPEMSREIINRIHFTWSRFPVIGSIDGDCCSSVGAAAGACVVVPGVVANVGSVVIGAIVVVGGSVVVVGGSVVVGAAVVVGGATQVTVVDTVLTTPLTVAVAV